MYTQDTCRAFHPGHVEPGIGQNHRAGTPDARAFRAAPHLHLCNGYGILNVAPFAGALASISFIGVQGMNELLRSVTQSQLRTDIPEFGSGDTVRVHAKVVEGTRERIQVFEGVVMRKRAGGIEANFTVRRVASHGIGVERTFMINSPRIDKIEVVRRGLVRRAQLYYLRKRTGKAARIKEKRFV